MSVEGPVIIRRLIILLGWLWLSGASAQSTPIQLRDDLGHQVQLPGPAQRVISLAPHLTELMYAAGAGAQLIATVDYSDYPQAAARLPRVGNAHALDLERIVAAKPDLVLAWASGNPRSAIDSLRQRGLRLVALEIAHLDDLPSTLQRIGLLTGHDAGPAAQALRRRILALNRPAGAQPPKVFFQIWDPPIMTVSNQHFIGDVLRRCGYRNIFGDLGTATPTVSAEAVLAARPDLIIASGMGSARAPWLDTWRRWPQIPAVKNNRLYLINGDLIARPSPRLVDAAEQVCGFAQQPATH